MLKPLGFLFDFDGVVADSISLHLRAWDLACEEIFGSALSPERRQRIVGMATREIVELLCSDWAAPHRGTALGQLKRDRLAEMRADVPLLPGARGAFALLDRLGLPYGIASNAPVAFIEKVLAKENISIATIIGIENSGRPKPFPDPFLACAKALGLSFGQHGETVVFEDSIHGLKAARTAGMIPVGLQTQHSDSYLKQHGAQITCRNLQEALDLGWFEFLPI